MTLRINPEDRCSCTAEVCCGCRSTPLRALCIERYGKDVKFERCEPRPSFLSGLTNFRSEIKVDVSVDDILDALAVRQHEAKYGL